METTNNSKNGQKQLLFLTWELKGRECYVDTAFIWRGNDIRVRVYSTSAVICTCVNFDIYFNKQLYHYHLLHSNGTATKLQIPEIKFDRYKMVFNALSTSMEIYEEQLTPNEIKVQEEISLRLNDKQKAPDDQSVPDDPNKYDFKPKANETWIAFLEDMITHEYKIAFPAPKVVIWVKKSLDRMFNPNVSLFTYEFYSRSVHPTPLESNGFICAKAYDVCEKTGNGTRCTIHYEITDTNNIVRKLDTPKQGVEGIFAILAFLGRVSKFKDWDEWDSKMELPDVNGAPEGLNQNENQSNTIDDQHTSTGDSGYNEETGDWEGEDYPEPPQREKESWVSVTKELTTEELEIPYIDSNLLLWIHKSFDYKHCDGFWMFKYDLFSPDFHPMQLTKGNFTCLSISDFCKSIGCGNYTTIKFEISDSKNTVYSFRGFTQMENGVIEAIKFMRTLRRFDDWKDYDTMKALAKSLGKTDEEMDGMIAGELKDTGISLT